MRNPLRNVYDVAAREFKATAMTKAFVFGVFLFPVIIMGVVFIAGGLFDTPDKQLKGTVGVLDQSGPEGAVAAALERAFEPEKLKEAYETKKAELQQKIDDMNLPPTMKSQAKKAIKKLPTAPDDVKIVRVASVDEVEAEKEAVRKGDRLALVVVTPESFAGEGKYQIWAAKNLDIELSRDLRDAAAKAIVDTRLTGAGLPLEQVRKLSLRPEADRRTVTESGSAKDLGELQLLLPMIFMMLLWISVFSAGQYLLTTTIEEKSSRVMELLLSAVSPMQLMTGKILGQGLVGLVILAVYGGIGVVAAVQFAVMDIVPVDKLVWTGVYFVIAYFLIASMMAAIGSAVNEMREAQSLMGVAMVILIIPMVLWMPIIRQPNSTFSTIASFIPPMTPFVMALRLGQSSEVIPTWQVWATTAVGALSVLIAVWAASKIFRVGVLMYGKPPTPLQMLKWLRQA